MNYFIDPSSKIKVKFFAMKKTQKLPGKPSIKIIILDEADHLTKDAQNALRRMIEDFSEITRFCLICNYVTKIIGPLNSRCMKFRFREIPKPEQIRRLEAIASQEKIKIEPEALGRVIDVSGGDLRKGLNLLQMADSVKVPGERLQQKDIRFISDAALADDVIEAYLEPYRRLASKRLENLEQEKLEYIEKLVRDGNTAQQIISGFYKCLWGCKQFGELEKARIVIALVDAQDYVLKGVDDVSVLSLLFNLCVTILG